MRFGAVLAFLILVVCGNAFGRPAQAKTFLQGIEQSIKRIDRQLCANSHSAACKTSNKKSKQVIKPKHLPAVPVAVAPKPMPAPPLPKLRPASLDSAVPVQTVAVTPKLEPVPPLKAKAALHLAPPLPKLRPASLDSAVPVLPVALPIAPKPVPVVPPPIPPVVKRSAPVTGAPVTPPVPPPVFIALVKPPAIDQASSCLAALAAARTSFAPVAQAETSLACQINTPVRLNSFTTSQGVVKLPDKPLFNCAFALKLSQFVDQQMQPLALQSMGSPVVAMGTGPGFNCRGRNGDSGNKMSEHATGDAVDIEYIKFANTSQILVKDSLNVQSLGFAFLRDVRAAACSDFTTVLGPGANAAHAEHFHIDLEVRRGGYRLCE